MRPALGLALCALALAVSGVASAATPGLSRERFGINAQNVFKLPEAEWDHQLAAIAATGVGEVRRDAFWSQVELLRPVHGVHSYDWDRPDAVAAALARNGLRWYPILDYATGWEGTLPGPSGWKSAPASPADFAAYAAAFARRYGSGGSFWSGHPSLPALPVQSYEIWNEPNLPEFWPDVTGAADRYASLLAATAPALRAADPSGRVVVGGLSSIGLVPFLDRIEATHPGLIAQMDVVAFHPYGTTFSNTGARVRVLRDWLDAHGAQALPIDVTETGWATPPLPESTRATRMAALVPGLARSSCGIAHVIVHTWLTPDVDATDPNDYFGIAHADATLKPTGVAFADAIAAVESGTDVAPGDPCAGRSIPVSQPPVPPVPPVPPPPSPPPPPPPPSSPPPADPPPADPPVLTSPVFAPPLPLLRAQAPAPAASPAAPRPVRNRVAAAAHRVGRTVVVEVGCSRACRPVVRVQRRGGKPIASSASGRFARRYRTRLRLPARGHGGVTIRVRAHMRGAPDVTVVRTLR